MKDSNPLATESPPVGSLAPRPSTLRISFRMLLCGIALLVCFAWPLYQWAKFALASDLYSYTLLVPFVSAYLFRTNQKRKAAGELSVQALVPGLILLIGILILAGFWLVRLSGIQLERQDAVAWTISSFVFILAGICAWGLRPAQLKVIAFPLAFLLFMVPFPVRVEHAIEAFLQQGSAPPAQWLFYLVGTPLFREDLVFHLPGITIQIAPECSGIRSTLVLFITSILAGYLFLHSPWKRTLLSLFVIPLALARNGLRVFTIGQLCVNVGPHMIDSVIHHRGGPLFFALSLVPFSALLYFLAKSDRTVPKPKVP